jgi:heme exporter protein B
MRALFVALYLRDLRLAMRRRSDALLPIGFFVIAVAMFPLGVGPEPQTLRQIAPGLMWVCALLASMLSVGQLYAGDFANGSLDQMLMSNGNAVVVALARAASHWTLTGLPLIVAAPLLGLLFDVGTLQLTVLAFSLLLGTPILSLLGSVGAALTLGSRFRR